MPSKNSFFQVFAEDPGHHFEGNLLSPFNDLLRIFIHNSESIGFLSMLNIDRGGVRFDVVSSLNALAFLVDH